MHTLKPRAVARARKAASAASPRRLRVGSAAAWRVIVSSVSSGTGCCSELWVWFCIKTRSAAWAALRDAPFVDGEETKVPFAFAQGRLSLRSEWQAEPGDRLSFE